jgi:tetratricopeptide (TPR) repeat protein
MNQLPRGTELEGHLSPEEIAELAERGRQGATAGALEHLSRCRSCMSAYADVVRYRAGWLAFPGEFQNTDGQGSSVGISGRIVPAAKHAPSKWFRAAASLIVIAGLGAWLLAGRREGRQDAGPITALLGRASAEGLVIPGGEAGAAPRSPLYRSETVVDGETEQALEQLRLDYEHHARTGANPRQLAAALVAVGQLDFARNYITEGLSRAPADAQLMTLAGIVAYQSGDPALAERHLRGALSASPDDLTAMLDLGLVLAHTRGPDQAGPYLKGVIEKAPHSALAARARAALAEHGRP